jgi:hypothetical protein
MSTSTKRDAIEAAMAVAESVSSGELSPDQLEQQLVAECRALVGTVVGPGPDDPIWELQVSICRGVLAAGGIPADELAEWAAVARRRESPAPLDAVARSEPVGDNRVSEDVVSAYGDSGGHRGGVGD